LVDVFFKCFVVKSTAKDKAGLTYLFHTAESFLRS